MQRAFWVCMRFGAGAVWEVTGSRSGWLFGVGVAHGCIGSTAGVLRALYLGWILDESEERKGPRWLQRLRHIPLDAVDLTPSSKHASSESEKRNIRGMQR